MPEESLLRSDVKRSFEGRLPKLAEVLLWGGQPGVEYCYVDGSNIGAFQDIGFEMIRDATVFGVLGPKGECPSILIMGRGTPIPGADPHNGIRVLGVDNHIRATTGVDMDEGYDASKPDRAPIRKASEKQEKASAPSPEAA